MPSINILVCQAHGAPLAESIAEGIRLRSDVTLFGGRVLPIQESGAAIGHFEASPSIVIIVGPAAELESPARDLQELDTTLVIARIATGCESPPLPISHDDLEELISAACALLPERGSRVEPRQINFEAVFDAFAIPRLRCRVKTGTNHHVLNQVTEWLDAVLLMYLRRNTDPGDDLPGLSVSRQTVEQLLSNSSIKNDGEHSSARLELAAAAGKLLKLLAEKVSPADPLAILCTRLNLTESDTGAFLLCLAPELDSRYQRIFGFINDDMGRRDASLGLIAALREDVIGARMELAASNRLFDWRVLQTADGRAPHADAPLRVDSSVLAWLFGQRRALLHDPLLREAVHEQTWPGARWLGQHEQAPVAQALEQALEWCVGKARWVILEGSDMPRWRTLLESASLPHHGPMLRISLASLSGADQVDERLLRLARAARLMNALPVLDTGDMDRNAALTLVLERAVAAFADLTTPGVLLISNVAQAIAAFPVTSYRILRQPSFTDSAAVFAAAARDAGLSLAADDLALLGAAYPLPLEGIERAVHLAAAGGAGSKPAGDQAALVGAACHLVACPNLPQFATRLAPSFELDDLVLPPDRRWQINEIVANVSHAGTVLNTWGFGAQLPYGRGVAALFSGASGTGKTMAARAIGHALRRNVFAVDLSRVLSKYIGEMEKNLHALFHEAEKAGAILLFDEADALFGKRSETKDAHDRYANIETAYLLQRVEAFSGLAILTTNFAQNLDRAFLRRLRFVIDFPSPGAADREKIWRKCMPKQAPQAQDIDWAFLAQRIEMTGGHIRQITLRAAFSAAAQGESISMDHLLRATRAEAIKLGMPALERELAEQVASA